jgi:hypothetical protein
VIDKLGMSFNEWRQRQKLVAALALLDAGRPAGWTTTRLQQSVRLHRDVSPPDRKPPEPDEKG